MQAFWVPSNVGNGQLSVPFTYLFDDRRWVPRGEVFLHPPGGRHQEQVWNVSCITCHTTAGQPNALVGGKEVRSQVAEMGIACEACHGPAEEHVAANQNPFRRYWLHLRHAGDPTIVNPARLDAARASEVCGQCHSLTDLSDEIYLGEGKTLRRRRRAGKDAAAACASCIRTPALARHVQEDPSYLRGYFWSDGTIRVSSRDYSGMIESKCMQSGKLWCGSCHSLHESDPVNLLAKDKDTDAACLSVPRQDRQRGRGAHAPPRRLRRQPLLQLPHAVHRLRPAQGHPQPPHRQPARDRPLGRQRTAQRVQPVPRRSQPRRGPRRSWRAGIASRRRPGSPTTRRRRSSGSCRATRCCARSPPGSSAGTARARRRPSPTRSPISSPRSPIPTRPSATSPVTRSWRSIPANQFDYLAPLTERQRAADQILQRWRAQHPDGARDAATIDSRIKRLIDKRDDSAVRAME